jgi:hypothetical protein
MGHIEDSSRSGTETGWSALIPGTLLLFLRHQMDFDTIDTDLWTEIQDMEAEIFDLPELRENPSQDFDSFLNSNYDF